MYIKKCPSDVNAAVYKNTHKNEAAKQLEMFLAGKCVE